MVLAVCTASVVTTQVLTIVPRGNPLWATGALYSVCRLAYLAYLIIWPGEVRNARWARVVEFRHDPGSSQMGPHRYFE